MELVLKSNEEKGRREIKSIVLKLLRENSSLPSYAGSSYICNESIYSSCRICLNSLLSLFKKAAEPEFTDKPVNSKQTVVKQIALEADNLSWLLEILADRQAADEFALMWSSQQELTALHSKLPIVSRYHVSCITSRLFVGIGRGELLPSKDTRHLLLQTWLQPLISDYSWLQHGCRSFDRKVVEEGIGRTILTLPLEKQQTILLSWLGTFLKSGDNCPNLQRAFEVWWRRTFIRPYMEWWKDKVIDKSLIAQWHQNRRLKRMPTWSVRATFKWYAIMQSTCIKSKYKRKAHTANPSAKENILLKLNGMPFNRIESCSNYLHWWVLYAWRHFTETSVCSF